MILDLEGATSAARNWSCRTSRLMPGWRLHDFAGSTALGRLSLTQRVSFWPSDFGCQVRSVRGGQGRIGCCVGCGAFEKWEDMLLEIMVDIASELYTDPPQVFSSLVMACLECMPLAHVLIFPPKYSGHAVHSNV